jgi:hypothetical protein
MIYALVEPSIYMIASILPTTRHLYRRVRRKARLASQQQSSKSNGGPKNSNLTLSADVERTGSKESTGRGIARKADIGQANPNSSQEELTMGAWYQSQQEWNEMRDLEGKSDEGALDTKPRDSAKKQFEVQDPERSLV